MNKKEMRDAIINFHKVYYAGDGSREAFLELHHAAEHLFDAAEITISISPNGANQKFIADAVQKKKPAKALENAWEKIEVFHRKNK